MLKILLNGSKGRMGQAITAAAQAAGAVISHAVDVGDRAEDGIAGCDVVIDFSFHAATVPLIELAARHGKPVIIGTTGHTDAEKQAIRALGAKVPIVWAGNYSIGVNLLNWLVGQAARTLGPEYQVEIVEMHHRHKKDAPSGTAEKLIEVVREARKLSADKVRHGRQGLTGERPADEIGVHALRGGDVIGDHTVMFAADGERVELTHKASSRTVFAQGAVRAAGWIVGRKPGIYGMAEVLGLGV